MTGRQKIILAIAPTLVVVGLLAALPLPSHNANKNLDFFIRDNNINSQLEVSEPLKFTINDSAAVADKRALWKMGNGDSIIGKSNASYVYKQAGKYFITLQIDSKVVTEKTVDTMKIVRDTMAVDSIPKIVRPTQGYVDERFAFSAEGDNTTNWLWEFGESGTIDAFEHQVVYKYDEPGKYFIKLKTNATLYPVFRVITILPKVENIIGSPADGADRPKPEPTGTLAMVQNGIKKHLQVIADASAKDKEAFYACRNFIINNYLGGNGNQVIVHINGERYNVFPGYCQGLHFPENNRYERVTIDDAKVDDFHHIIKVEVIQRNTGE